MSAYYARELELCDQRARDAEERARDAEQRCAGLCDLVARLVADAEAVRS